MVKTKVIKKNGVKEDFNPRKIIKAILISANRIKKDFPLSSQISIIESVLEYIDGKKEVSVSEIYFIVEQALWKVDKDLYKEYRRYSDYKRKFNMSFESLIENSKKIIFNGDTENANKDSSLNSTQKELLAGLISKELMMNYELFPEVVEAHTNNWIYIHDLSDRILFGINCCLFDMKSLLEGGFEMDGVILNEPKYIETAVDLVSNTIINASSQQYGGFTVPEIDTTLAKYAENTYKRELEYHIELGLCKDKARRKARERAKKIIYDKIESLEYQVNLLNNANGQTSFVTFTFGLDTSEWGRYITSCILRVRLSKMGKNKMTAIFPKLVFLHRKEINGIPGTPNYDLKKLAIKCSMKNLYPDWLSLDSGHLGDVYDRCGKAVSPMGQQLVA